MEEAEDDTASSWQALGSVVANIVERARMARLFRLVAEQAGAISADSPDSAVAPSNDPAIDRVVDSVAVDVCVLAPGDQ